MQHRKTIYLVQLYLTRTIDIDKQNYLGDGIGFDRKVEFPSGNRVGREVIIFGVDMSSSLHIHNNNRKRSW